MQQTITINESLLKNAAQCVGLEDINDIVNLALEELIKHHQPVSKRRQAPASIAGKGIINGDLLEPIFASEDFECLK